METPEKLQGPEMSGRLMADERGLLIGPTRRGNSNNNLPAPGSANQDRVRQTMVKALRRWLEGNELPAIIIAVLGVVATLSTLLVVGGYLLVTP
jgi:hypothetical protein